MPYFRQGTRNRILNGKTRVCLVALCRGRFAPSNILDHPLVIDHFTADCIANYARIFRYPDHSAIPAIDLRFKVYDLTLFAYEPDKFGPATRLDIELVPDVRECSNQVIG